jgi:general secretion pathway protein H
MPKHHKIQGMTLIEILVVMVIISIVSGAALLTISRNQNEPLRLLTLQLTHAFTLAEEQAIVQSTVLGFALSSHTLQFYQYQEKTPHHDNCWKALTDLNLGKKRIAEDIKITLKTPDATIKSIQNIMQTEPPLLFYASGDMTPFIMLIGKKNQKPRYQIIGTAGGEIRSGESA